MGVRREGLVSGESSTRRQFGRIVAGSVVGAFAAPGIVRGRNLNERLTIAVIGVGGRGASNLADVSSENIVSLCDVYEPALGRPTAFAVYQRSDLEPGSELAGPALIEEGQTTTVVPASFTLHVDGAGYLVMESRDE